PAGRSSPGCILSRPRSRIGASAPHPSRSRSSRPTLRARFVLNKGGEAEDPFLQTSVVILIVGLAILAALVFDLWLDSRQIRWIRGHRDSVPAAFAGRIGLDEHRKAVDYSIEKLQVARIDSVVGSALSALLLIGGLFAVFERNITDLVGTGYLAGLLLAGALLLTFAIVELPFSIWRTFKIEQKFGFNRTTPGLFIADMAKGAAVGVVLGT